MNEELEYTIKEQTRTIDNQMERVAKLVQQMQEHINGGDYTAAARMLGTFNISGDVEGLTTALASYNTLLEVRHMVDG